MRRLFFVLSFIASLQLYAQVPGTLSYQGILTDNSGNPVSDGVSILTFNFYTVATAGTPVQTRGPLNVTTSKGLFTTVIGDGSTNNAALPASLFNQEFWIGITIGVGTSEQAPRVRITAVPYANRAQTANSLDDAATVQATQITSGTIADARLNTHLQDLADGSLSGSKVGSGMNATNITTGTLTSVNISLAGNDASKLAGGTTAQRPVTPVEGQIRYNSTEKVMEYYNGTTWNFLTPKVAYLKDVKPSGTDAGSFNVGGWRARTLNTLEGDNSFVSLINNTVNNTQFTLNAGTYLIEATAPAYRVLRHKSKLYNITSSTDALIGTSELTEDAANTTGNNSSIAGILTVPSSMIYELQHVCWQSYPGNGFGTATATTVVEVYATVKITKLR